MRVSDERVDNTILRETFLNSGLILAEAAMAAGFVRKRGTQAGFADVTRFQRRLGIKPNKGRNGLFTYQSTVSYDDAVRLARALGLDPVDVGV